MKFLRTLAIAALFSAQIASAADAAAEPPEARVARMVQTYTKDKVIPDSVSRSPIPGVWEVRAGLDIFYVDDTGQYAFVEGHLFDLKNTRDLTAERLDAAARIQWKDLPLELALKTVRGDGHRRIAVFEDPTCAFCRSLRTLINQLDDITIYTFPYPVLSAESDAKAKAALCAPDRRRAWDELMKTGRAPDSKPCQTQVARLLELGTRLNVRGTPTVFFADGRRSQGAVPPDQFMNMLAEASK